MKYHEEKMVLDCIRTDDIIWIFNWILIPKKQK